MKRYGTTDTDNSQRFTDKQGMNIRWIPLRNLWLVWNGKFWNKEEGEDSALSLGEQVALNIQSEIVDENEPTKKTELIRWANSSLSVSKRRAMIALAKPKIRTEPEELDKNDWIFACQNGTINLKTGKLQESKRGDFCTRFSPIAFKPRAKCPKWMKFLSEITEKDKEIMGLLQRMAGYGLTGSWRERKVFLLCGDGHNGKSTLCGILSHVMGSYAVEAKIRTFLIASRQKDGSAHDADLVPLVGARFVTAGEPEKKSVLAESVVKQMTGGDRIPYRESHGKMQRTFLPKFTPVLYFNDPPTITGKDKGIWGRIIKINFSVTYSDSPKKGEFLRNSELRRELEEESEGILAWAVRGCLDWQKRDNLGVPEQVTKVVQQYEDSQDPLNGFIDKMLIKRSNVKCRVDKLNDSYIRFCEDNGFGPVSKIALGKELNRVVGNNIKPFGPSNNRQRYRLGIGIKND